MPAINMHEINAFSLFIDFYNSVFIMDTYIVDKFQSINFPVYE